MLFIHGYDDRQIYFFSIPYKFFLLPSPWRETKEALTTSPLPFTTERANKTLFLPLPLLRSRSSVSVFITQQQGFVVRSTRSNVQCFRFQFPRRIPRGDAFDGGAHSRGSTSLNGRGGLTTTSRDKFVWIINNKVPRGIVSATRDTSFPTISNSVVRG